MQGQGLNVQALSWLLERAPADAAEEVVRFDQALFALGVMRPLRALVRSFLAGGP